MWQFPFDPDALNVAVLASRTNRGEFDGALRQTGWKSLAYTDDGKAKSKLLKNLDQHDILLATPGTNALNQDENDHSSVDALRGFMERGGAIVLPGIVDSKEIAWLSSLAPESKVEALPRREQDKFSKITETVGVLKFYFFEARDNLPEHAKPYQLVIGTRGRSVFSMSAKTNGHSIIGNSIRTTKPCGSRLDKCSFPPCVWTTRSTIVRPKPVPKVVREISDWPTYKEKPVFDTP